MTIDSFSQVFGDERIESITIVDDASTDDSYEKLSRYFRDSPKVNVFSNKINLDCYANKHQAMQKSNSKWCILLDSDNVIDKSYLDAIYAIKEWDAKTIYQPSNAKPHFNFTKWEGLTLTKENVAQYADTHLMTSMNACNHFVNRENYLDIWDGSTNPGSSDSLYFSTLWLENGGKIYITPNLTYEHYISDKNDGHYQTHSHLFREFHEKLMDEIRQLK
jgi:glycosyltransferase involved in cell wall biosynthesis